MPEDTIAAIATPPGRGGIGVLRISGPDAVRLAEGILRQIPPPRRATLLPFLEADGATLDTGLAIFFRAPASFTGEDVLELHAHGGPVLMDLLLRRALALGARLARPGEFSQRAFLNGKLDLAQAEAIADLIDGGSEQAVRSAQRSLQGEFSRRVHALVARLVELRTFVEGAIDFPDEDLDALSDSSLTEAMEGLRRELFATLAQAREGNVLREGMTVVLAGRPNVGKSSLLNRLAQRDAAIVTPVPGTTRDLLREVIQVDGMPLHVVDTAGLRRTEDTVERHGIERAWQAIGQADAVLLVVEERAGISPEEEQILERLPARLERVIVFNKIDLGGGEVREREGHLGHEVYLSALSGAGMELLKKRLKSIMGFSGTEGVFTARRRHLEGLRLADVALRRAEAINRDTQARELVAEELREAQRCLGELTGAFTSEDLLDRIFASFCIGK